MTQTPTQTDGGFMPATKISPSLLTLLLPLLLVAQPVHAIMESKLETVTCDAVKGWAWNSASPSTRVKVDIYDVTATKTTLLATVTAQTLRNDLLAAGKGDGKYGFTYVLPPSVRNALTHKISARYKGTVFELTGSPITTTLPCYGKLNDTGWQKCSTNTGNGLACPLTDYPRQDADYGRDKAASSGQLLKIGAGSAGFDYTKIANDGTALAPTVALGSGAKAWACTQDNLTGLLWEVKTTDGGLRDADNTHSWYNPNAATNGGFVGIQDNGNCTGGIACDTLSYVQAVNASKLCGKSDWRLPRVEELISLSDYTRAPAINPVYFPNTPPYWYVSSTIGPVDSGKARKGLWGIYPTTGFVADDLADLDGKKIRLVRGN